MLLGALLRIRRMRFRMSCRRRAQPAREQLQCRCLFQDIRGTCP
jgi:hypothetical protein